MPCAHPWRFLNPAYLGIRSTRVLLNIALGAITAAVLSAFQRKQLNHLSRRRDINQQILTDENNNAIHR